MHCTYEIQIWWLGHQKPNKLGAVWNYTSNKVGMGGGLKQMVIFAVKGWKGGLANADSTDKNCFINGFELTFYYNI